MLSRQPHVLVVIAGVNDVYQERPVEHTKKHLRWIYNRAAEAGIPVVAGSILPYNTATADQNARMKAINAWIAGEATRDPNLTFVDTRAAVAATDNPNRLASSPDDLHPDVEGYRKVAAAIGPVVDVVLAQAKASAAREPE